MAQEIKKGDKVEVISKKHIMHWLEIPQIVTVTSIGYNILYVDGTQVGTTNKINQGVSMKDIKLINNKTNKMKNTTQTQKIKQVAIDLLKANNTVTTLEIKNELRKKFSLEKWFQSDISDVMDDLSDKGEFNYVSNGTYRIYSAVAKKTVTPTVVATVVKTPSKSTKISRTKAIELITNSNGRFFGVTFTKKDNTVRSMRCKIDKDAKPSPLGYITVKDTTEAKPKSLNLQTLSEIRMNKTTYKVA